MSKLRSTLLLFSIFLLVFAAKAVWPKHVSAAWTTLGTYSDLNCPTTVNFSPVTATRFRITLLNVIGGDDTKISYGTSGGGACTNTGTDGVWFNVGGTRFYANPLTTCPFTEGEQRITSSFSAQSVSQFVASVGCNDNEKMEILVEYDTADEPPPPDSCWKVLGNVNGLGCGTNHSFNTVNATAFKFKMLSGGGPDCKISYGLASSGHPACQVAGGGDGVSFFTTTGKVYANPVNVCPLVCYDISGEWRQTPTFPAQEINQLSAKVGCNGPETMNIELWYCEEPTEPPPNTPTPIPPGECADGLNCCVCKFEGEPCDASEEGCVNGFRNGVCLELGDFCDEGYEARCTSNVPATCDGQAGCECVKEGIGSTDLCGQFGEPCCSGGVCRSDLGYYCANDGICKRISYLAKVGEVFCDDDGKPTKNSKDSEGNPRPLFTAIGCIPTNNYQAFATFMLTWGIGIGGGLVFLVLVYGGFLFMTSQGNPQRLRQGKTVIGAGLSGLVLLIFSVTILRIIGVDILGLPAF